MKRLKKLSKKRIAVIAAIVLAVAAALYTLLSVQAWQKYQQRLESTQTELSGLRQTATTSNDTSKRLAAIRELDDRLSERDTFCEADPLYAWQANVVPMIGEGVATCEATVKELDTTAQSLSELRSFLDTGLEIQSVLQKDLAARKTLSEKDWKETGLNSAKRLETALASVDSNTPESDNLKREAQGYAENLTSAWQSLLKAHAKEDRAAFEAAEEDILAAYAAFAGLADTSDEVIKEKAAELSKRTFDT